MKRFTWILVGVATLGLPDPALCKDNDEKADAVVLLRAQLKLLKSKLERQGKQLEAMQIQVEQLKKKNARLKDLCHKAGIDTTGAEAYRAPSESPKTPADTPTKKPAQKSIPVSIKHVLVYAFERQAVANKQNMEVRRTKILHDALVRIKSMLARGPITLTYQVCNVATGAGNVAHVSVGGPKEILDACVAARKVTSATAKSSAKYRCGTFSVILSQKQALTIKQGDRFVLKGRAELRTQGESYELPEGSITVPFSMVTLTPYVVRQHGESLIMTAPACFLKGREVKLGRQ